MRCTRSVTKIAMHIAARAPLWISREDIPADLVEQKRAELTEQAHKTGKPRDIVEKMVEGRMRKFFEEVVLSRGSSPAQTWYRSA